MILLDLEAYTIRFVDIGKIIEEMDQNCTYLRYHLFYFFRRVRCRIKLCFGIPVSCGHPWFSFFIIRRFENYFDSPAIRRLQF